jgi:hypothetical protein
LLHHTKSLPSLFSLFFFCIIQQKMNSLQH